MSSATKSPSNSPLEAQWDCIRQNIGTWHGSFSQFSPTGELVKDTPSVLTLEETELDQTMALTLERFPDGEEKKVNNLTFTAPGPAPYVYFFPSGAFAQGSAQWSSFGQFGTEISLKVGDRRVRYVIMYEGTSHYTSQLKYVTLICETQESGTQFIEKSTTVEQLKGKWKGRLEAIKLTDKHFVSGTSEWDFSADKLTCREKNDGESQSLSVANVCIIKHLLQLTATEKGALNYQMMLLTKGAYCLLPQEIKQGAAFRIEVGWICLDGARTRFIRYYDTRGVCTDSVLIEDRLVGEIV